jgi:peptidoglycan/LPS O-acetylase OafA/YrhL
VLLYHVQGYVVGKLGRPAGAIGAVRDVLETGSFGVPLFFAISGYILCRPFLGGRNVSLRRYFLRRFTRLEPPYILRMLLVFTAKIAGLGLAGAALFPNLVASLLYSHNLVYAEHSAVNGVAWSLEVEWQFYLLAPLLFLALVKARPAWRHLGLACLVGLGGLAYAVDARTHPRFSLSLLHYFGFFASGMWVAVLDEDHAGAGRGQRRLDLAGAGAAIAIVAILVSRPVLVPLLPALTGVVVFAATRGPWLRALLGWWPIYCVGAMCYTIYLYHFFVVSAVGKLIGATLGWPADPAMALLLLAAIAVPVVVVACLLPYLLIERPFMVWRPGRNRLADAYRELLH